MNRALVVYGTKTGCTRGIAEQIGETLSTMGVEAAVVRAEDKPDPANYDAVLVGSGVRAGNWHGAVKSWVSASSATLSTLPVAFFTVCLTVAAEPEKTAEVRAYTDSLIAQTGVRPVDVGLFAGMVDLKAFSLPERLIMKAMKAEEGDYRDMVAVAAWTRQVAETLGLAG